MKNLKMWTNECDYIIAESLEEAQTIAMNICGYSDDDISECEWSEMVTDQEFTFCDEAGDIINKTIGEFIEQHGEGYFACSDY